MKKQIPEKVANKVYDKLLAGKRLEQNRCSWIEEIVYKPNTNQLHNRYYLHNRFFKSSVGKYFRYCKKDEWDIENKLVSTRKRWESTQEQLNDYI